QTIDDLLAEVDLGFDVAQPHFLSGGLGFLLFALGSLLADDGLEFINQRAVGLPRLLLRESLAQIHLEKCLKPLWRAVVLNQVLVFAVEAAGFVTRVPDRSGDLLLRPPDDLAVGGI